MDVHPTKNGINRYWSIPTWNHRIFSMGNPWESARILAGCRTDRWSERTWWTCWSPSQQDGTLGDAEVDVKYMKWNVCYVLYTTSILYYIDRLYTYILDINIYIYTHHYVHIYIYLWNRTGISWDCVNVTSDFVSSNMAGKSWRIPAAINLSWLGMVEIPELGWCNGDGLGP